MKIRLKMRARINSISGEETRLGGVASNCETIHSEEALLTVSHCQLVNYLNESALACTYLMAAHVANCYNCRMIKQIIVIRLTISRGELLTELRNVKETSIVI